MRTKSRERTIRVVAGTLLTSDLSLAEISALGRAMHEGSQLARDLGHLLEDTVLGIEPSHGSMKTNRVGARIDAEPAGLVDQIMAVLKRRRKAKKVVVKWLNSLGNGQVGDLNPVWSLREIVSKFVARAPAVALERLQNDMGLETPATDPYLKGIMKKQENENTRTR